MKLPKTIYVRWEDNDDNDSWLMAQKEIADLLEAPPDEQTVGVYRLERTVKAKSKVEFKVE